MNWSGSRWGKLNVFIEHDIEKLVPKRVGGGGSLVAGMNRKFEPPSEYNIYWRELLNRSSLLFQKANHDTNNT